MSGQSELAKSRLSSAMCSFPSHHYTSLSRRELIYHAVSQCTFFSPLYIRSLLPCLLGSLLAGVTQAHTLNTIVIVYKHVRQQLFFPKTTICHYLEL